VTVAATNITAAVGKQLNTIILDRVAGGRLVLPVLPEVATKCLTALKETDFHQQRLVSQLEADPLLAALVIRTANTAAHGASVRGLDQAVGRLGQGRMKTLMVEYMAHEVFRSTDPRIEAAAKKVWRHSLAVAHLARDLAAFTGAGDAAAGEAAYLGGLLHDIGKPVLAAMLLDVERHTTAKSPTAARMDERDWVDTIEALHRNIGVAIATKWKLADDVTAAIRDCSDFDNSDRKGVANIVRFANALAKREGYTTGPIDAADIDALVMVGRSLLGADDALLKRLTGSLAERLAGA
jgi:putative nucleotidyltransferase with HDIG domain